MTGGAGFIGAHLAERLLADEWSVRVLDDFSTGCDENLAACGDRLDVRCGDVRDVDAVESATAGVDIVFHLAAVASVPRSQSEPVLTNAVNVGGTVAVLDAASRQGVSRVVYAASSSAYGDRPELPKSEEMAPTPGSPYALQKLTGEGYCALYAARGALETVALRFFNVYGPRQDPMSDYAAVIPRFIEAALACRPAEIHGDGEQTRDFVFISDVVDASLLAADAGGVSGAVINVAAGKQTSLNELWQAICAAADVDLPARHVDARPGDVRNSHASLKRARDLLGYEPVVDLALGLRRTLENQRKSGSKKGMMR